MNLEIVLQNANLFELSVYYFGDWVACRQFLSQQLCHEIAEGYHSSNETEDGQLMKLKKKKERCGLLTLNCLRQEVGQKPPCS